MLVVAAAEGYPADVRTGDAIEGLDAARPVDGVDVLCAGVADGGDGRLVTAGGRVLDVVGRGPDARHRPCACLRGASATSRGPALHHRTDIANEVLT